MDIAVASTGYLVALACAAVMGFAIQRGATCMVAAVDEVITRRRCTRLVAMAEASLWVAGGLVIAIATGFLDALPSGHRTSLATIGGGALLGLGAHVNRACVFGAIARLGSGEWAYLASPLGFLAGCAALSSVAALPATTALAAKSPILAVSGPTAAFVALAATARLALAWRAGVGRWTPHAATTVIGITFVVTFVLAGAWAYTDALADIARGSWHDLPSRLVLALALLAGAVAGGWTSGRLASRRVTAGGLARCFAGGALMGAGSLLVPGSNDGLILVGMPLLHPYAWIAFATMGGSIALAMVAARRFARAPAAALHGS